jgi:hypothetical protein
LDELGWYLLPRLHSSSALCNRKIIPLAGSWFELSFFFILLTSFFLYLSTIIVLIVFFFFFFCSCCFEILQLEEGKPLMCSSCFFVSLVDNSSSWYTW